MIIQLINRFIKTSINTFIIMENTNNTSINVNVDTNVVTIRIPKGRRSIRLTLPTLYFSKDDLMSLFTPTLKTVSNICHNIAFALDYAILEIINELNEFIGYTGISSININIVDNGNIKIIIDTEKITSIFILSPVLLSKQNIIDLLSNDYNKTISVIKDYTNTLSRIISKIQCKVDKMNK